VTTFMANMTNCNQGNIIRVTWPFIF